MIDHAQASALIVAPLSSIAVSLGPDPLLLPPDSTQSPFVHCHQTLETQPALPETLCGLLRRQEGLLLGVCEELNGQLHGPPAFQAAARSIASDIHPRAVVDRAPGAR